MPETPANFKLRLLARLQDDALVVLPHSFVFFLLTASQSLSEFFSGFFLYLITAALPSIFVVGVLYYAYMTHKFGGTVGKILTGLTVTNGAGQRLSFKRSLFRHIIGYQFSSLVFGLGFLSVIKDPQKQGWHDKAVGSRVLVTATRWQVGVTVLIVLAFTNVYLFVSTIQRAISGPLRDETIELFQTLSTPKYQLPKSSTTM